MTLQDSSKKVPSLFLDAARGLSLGLLSGKEWLYFKHFEVTKSSDVLYSFVHQMLEERKLRLAEIQEVIVNVGPGSYTGLRLCSLFGELMALEGAKTTRFTAFDLLNELGGDWVFVCYAFKSEFMLWDGRESLLNRSAFEMALKTLRKQGKSISYLQDYRLDEYLQDSDVEVKTLVYEHPEVLDLLKGKKLKRKAFYFRSLEKEFSPPRQGQ